MIRQLSIFIAVAISMLAFFSVDTHAQEIDDIIGGVIGQAEGNPLAKACDEGGQGSSYCEQINSDQGSLASCNSTGAQDGLVANQDTCRDNPIMKIIKIALQLVTALAAGLSVIFIIIGAIKYGASGGSAEGIASARKMILYALVGLALTISAGSVVALFLSGI